MIAIDSITAIGMGIALWTNENDVRFLGRPAKSRWIL